MVSSSSFRHRLVHCFLRAGRRGQAERLVATTLTTLKVRLGPNRQSFLAEAIEALTPRVRLRSKRKAGISYRIPIYLVRPNGQSFAFRWLRQAARARPERRAFQRLLAELEDARSRRGEAYRRRESVHATALLNRGMIRLLR